MLQVWLDPYLARPFGGACQLARRLWRGTQRGLVLCQCLCVPGLVWVGCDGGER